MPIEEKDETLAESTHGWGNIARLLIELRPRLQSANFFISFRRRFAEIESTKIDLSTDRIVISTANSAERYEIRLGNHFSLHTETLSSLLIKNNYVCFRINTNEAAFASEFLKKEAEGRLPTGGSLCAGPKGMACTLEPNVAYNVLCGNCGSPLREDSTATMFRRILELPSEQMDSSDWYCHGDHQLKQLSPSFCSSHSNGEATSDGDEETSTASRPTFVPSETELFYGPFYVLLNVRAHLQRVHIKAERYVYCKRCLLYLGAVRRNVSGADDAGVKCAKIWYENLRFLPHVEDPSIGETPNALSLFRNEDLLTNFKYLVRKLLNDFNFMSHLGLPPMFKVIFEMRRPGLEADVYYLLMQIMDANLTVFKIRRSAHDECDSSLSPATDENIEPNEAADDDDAEDDEDDEDDNDKKDDTKAKKIRRRIHLAKHRTMKLMYRYEKFEEQPIINYWMQDENVVCVEISEQMFRAAIRYLDDNSELVPESYRYNLGFASSYMNIT